MEETSPSTVISNTLRLINDLHVLGTVEGPATCTDWLDFKSCFGLSVSFGGHCQEVQGDSDSLELIPSELSLRLSGVTRGPQPCTEGWAGGRVPTQIFNYMNRMGCKPRG